MEAGPAPSDAGNADTDSGAASGGAFYPPGAKLMYVGQGPSAGLEIVAANLLLPSSPGSSARWLVAVKNGGADPICYVGVNAEFKSAAGSVLASVTMNIDGETYLSGTSSTKCIGQGKTAVGLWTQLSTTPIDPNAIDRIEHGFAGNIMPGLMPANRATLTNARVEMGPFPGWVVKGTVTASQAIRYVFVNAYPKNAAGRPLEQLVISNAALASGAPWDFTTTSFRDQFSDYYLTLNYTFP